MVKIPTLLTGFRYPLWASWLTQDIRHFLFDQDRINLSSVKIATDSYEYLNVVPFLIFHPLN